MTYIDLEFETEASRGAPLGDIASSLVTIDDLLRDLATISADSSTAEFREVRVVAIQLRNPLKIKLSLFAIPAKAVTAFQEICRDIIVFRERRVEPLARITRTLGVTDAEAQRLSAHIMSLRNAAVPLKRVVVSDE
ncbi:MAG TPA: hypothetical protein VJ691_01205 [Vicinamibacterales bacterium]|nr:hypothetical protein [Vicinamibacterales bacterium]